MINNPEILILDEATSALLPGEVDWLLKIARARAEAGKLVLYISHRMAEVRRVAEKGVHAITFSENPGASFTVRSSCAIASFASAGTDACRHISLYTRPSRQSVSCGIDDFPLKFWPHARRKVTKLEMEEFNIRTSVMYILVGKRVQDKIHFGMCCPLRNICG